MRHGTILVFFVLIRYVFIYQPVCRFVNSVVRAINYPVGNFFFFLNLNLNKERNPIVISIKKRLIYNIIWHFSNPREKLRCPFQFGYVYIYTTNSIINLFCFIICINLSFIWNNQKKTIGLVLYMHALHMIAYICLTSLSLL